MTVPHHSSMDPAMCASMSAACPAPRPWIGLRSGAVLPRLTARSLGLVFVLLLSACSGADSPPPDPVGGGEGETPAPFVVGVDYDAELVGQRWQILARETGDAPVPALRRLDSRLAMTELIEGSVSAVLVHRRASLPEERHAEGDDIVPRPPLTYSRVARVPVVLLVHEASPVRELSVAQATQLLSGEIRQWELVGGTPGGVVVYGRARQSEVNRLIRTELLGGSELLGALTVLPSDVAVSKAVADHREALGLGGGELPEGVRSVGLRGADGRLRLPGGRAAEGLDWPLVRDLYVVTVGPPEADVMAFVRLARSAEGARLAELSGGRSAGDAPLGDAPVPEAP